MKLVLLVLSLACMAPAYALQKCTLPNGKVEYTDQQCQAGAAVSRPHLIDNSIDSTADREEIEEGQRQAQMARMQSYAGGGSGGAVDRSNSYSCRQAMKNFQTGQSSITKGRPTNLNPPPDDSVARACGSGYAATYATPPAAEPPARRQRSLPAPPQPTSFTSCDSGGCWDNMGGRYTAGAGGTYFGPGGQVCQRTGGMIECH